MKRLLYFLFLSVAARRQFNGVPGWERRETLSNGRVSHRCGTIRLHAFETRHVVVVGLKNKEGMTRYCAYMTYRVHPQTHCVHKTQCSTVIEKNDFLKYCFFHSELVYHMHHCGR